MFAGLYYLYLVVRTFKTNIDVESGKDKKHRKGMFFYNSLPKVSHRPKTAQLIGPGEVQHYT